MSVLIVILHVLAALLLIGVVLIQRGQGAEMGVSFGGGGAQTLFGSRGSGSFLGKLTGALAAVFMATSLTLALFSQKESGSVVEKAVTSPTGALPQTPLPTSEGGLDPSKLKQEKGTEGLPEPK